MIVAGQFPLSPSSTSNPGKWAWLPEPDFWPVGGVVRYLCPYSRLGPRRRFAVTLASKASQVFFHSAASSEGSCDCTGDSDLRPKSAINVFQAGSLGSHPSTQLTSWSRVQSTISRRFGPNTRTTSAPSCNGLPLTKWPPSRRSPRAFDAAPRKTRLLSLVRR